MEFTDHVIAWLFEKLEKVGCWTAEVCPLEEHISDVERWLIEKSVNEM
jgi:hypothetical protein